MFFGWLLSLALFGCASSSSPCGSDVGEGILDDESDLGTFWIGRIAVKELDQRSGPEIGHSTAVAASFTDFSGFTLLLPERTYFSKACFVYMTRLETEGTKQTLAVSEVAFRGLVEPGFSLLPEGNGSFKTKVPDGRIFAQDELEVEVQPGPGESAFPALTGKLRAPDLPQLTRLGEVPDPDLRAPSSIGITADRPEDLKVQWKPGAGDYMDFVLIPGNGSLTKFMKLRCITPDDGCLSVPAAALQYLAQDKAQDFQLKLTRSQVLLHYAEQGGVRQAAAFISAEAAIEGTVLR